MTKSMREAVEVTVKSLGDRKVKVDVGAIMRVEDRTGKSVGEILELFGTFAQAAKKAKASDDPSAGLTAFKTLRMSFVINFVAAILEIPEDKISSVFKLGEPWKIYAELSPAFAEAASDFLSGGEEEDADNPPAPAGEGESAG